MTGICEKCNKQFITGHARNFCYDCKPANRKRGDLPAVGTRYGRLTLLGCEYRQCKTQNFLYARVRCDCGCEKRVLYDNVRNGKTKSCGCARKESLSKTREVRKGKSCEKTKAIIADVEKNPFLSLQDLGDLHGVSRQHVSALLIANGIHTPDGRKTSALLREENNRLRAYIAANGLEVPIFD